MAMSIGGTIDKVAEMRVMDMPVGKTLLLLCAIGLGKGVTDIVFSRWPTVAKYAGVVGGGGLAFLAKKVGVVKGFLGETGAELVAMGGLSAAILSFYDVQGKVESTIAGLGMPKVAAKTSGIGAVPYTGSPQVYESDVERRLAAIRRAQVARI